MHIVDGIVLTVIAVYIIIGINRGFIEEIFHLAAMLGGFIGAFLTYPLIYNKIEFLKQADQTKTVISFVLAYIVIAFSLIFIGWMLKKIIHLTMLGWIDRLLGGTLGICKAFILIWIFMLSISMLPKSSLKKSFSSSKTYSIIKTLPVKLTVPRAEKIKKYYSDIKKAQPVKKIKESEKKIKSLKGKISTFRTFVDSTGG